MGEEHIGRLIYLVLLVTVIGGWFFMQNRHLLGKMLQQALIWGFILIGTVGAVGLWQDIRDDIAPRQTLLQSGSIAVPRATDGHYYLSLELNGTPVRFVVDTGATDLVLSQRDAQRIGIDTEDLAFLGRANTANGMVATADVSIDQVTLGPITDRNVRASVNGGEMTDSLLGMNYLNRFERIEIADGRLILTR